MEPHAVVRLPSRDRHPSQPLPNHCLDWRQRSKLKAYPVGSPYGLFCADPSAFLRVRYTNQLKSLQEEVPPQPIGVIRGIVESEFGCKLEEIFAEFAEVPLGAASIGQVHLARLRNGQRVVVKVQYPETEHFFHLDFMTMTKVSDTGGRDIH